MYYAGDKRKSLDTAIDRLSGRLLYSVNLVSSFENKDILVVGDSYGWFAKYALENKAKTVYSFDIAEPDNQIKVLQKKYKNFTHFQGSVLDFKIPKIFDAVLYLEVIEHIPSGAEDISIKQISSHMRKNAELIISTPIRSALSIVGDPAYLFGHRHYTIENLVSLVTTNKLSIKQITRGGYFYSVIDLYLLYITKWILHKPYKSKLIKKINQEYPHSSGTTVFMVCQKS